MTTLFISDLHLDSHHPHITELFLNFLKTTALKADALYILGDLFEAWIGDDNQTEYNRMIIQALKAFSQSGIPLYIMRGNRDFLLGQKFAQATGCILINDPTVLDLYGQPTVLLHGDSLNTLDKSHQNFRKWTQKSWLKKFFLSLPLSWRQGVANHMRQSSYKRLKTLADDIMDVPMSAIENLGVTYPNHLIIHGHTHRPSIEFISKSQRIISRIVLSDWGKTGNILVCKSDGSKKLLYFSNI